MYLGVFGFPGSGEEEVAFLLRSCGLKIGYLTPDENGVVTWRMHHKFLPYERVRQRGQDIRHPKGPPMTGGGDNAEPTLDKVIHLMRYPWHAIATAANFDIESLELVKRAAEIHPRTPATHLTTWESRVKTLVLAYPKLYDKIRELHPDMLLKVEYVEERWSDVKKLLQVNGEPVFPKRDVVKIAPVDFNVATQLAGEHTASQVEVIARNLYKHVPTLL